MALEPEIENLEDVLIVAYGTATKSSFTGSAAMVSSEKIASHIATNVTSALAGTTPGVQIISSSGDPASNGVSIRVRGIGSMSASSAPLVVVDGMPYQGSISDINSNDVESMSVLKDAAASAIYGARGANGVILVTTKRATGGNLPNVKFDAKWGVNSRLIPQYDVITDPAEYYETYYRMMYNSQYYAGKSVADSYAYANKYLFDGNNGGLGYNVYTVPEGENLIGTNFKINPKATLGYSDGEYYYTPDNWYNEVFHSSFRQEYNLSVSGVKDQLSYYASAGILDDGGIVDNSNYRRYTGRINADYQAKPWLKFTTNISYSYSDSQTPSYSAGTFGSSGNIFYICNNIAPIYPLYVRNADGTIKTENGRIVYDANQTNFKRPNFVGNAVRDNEYNTRQNYADVITGKWGVVLTPFKGFSLTANLGLMTTTLASIFPYATSSSWLRSFSSNGYSAACGCYSRCNNILYDKIPSTDVRKGWWVDENLYSPLLNDLTWGRYTGQAIAAGEITDEKLAFQTYTNVKFGTNPIGTTTNVEDWPFMRVEEMILIEAECYAKSGNTSKAKEILNNFVKTYRDPSYDCSLTGRTLENEIWFQRRVELWGEGFANNDIRRLGKPMVRFTDAKTSIVPEAFRFNMTADDGWWLLRFTTSEMNTNFGIVDNTGGSLPVQDQNPELRDGVTD
jgi:TonB-dependent outer membrane receptor, SusC/RagA subfamily, signature region